MHLSTRLSRLTDRKFRKGQALVEFALTVPILLLILLACMEIGFLLNGHIMLANAAREGTRAAALGQTLPSVNNRVISMSGRLNVAGNHITVEKSTDDGVTWTTMSLAYERSVSQVSTSYNSASAGDLIRVTVTVPYRQITNFLPGLNGLPITKMVVMRREPT